MVKFLRVGLSAVLLVLCSPGGAKASIIDFQQLEHNDALTASHGNQYIEDGFVLNNLSELYPFASFGTLSDRYTGSTALFNNTSGGDTQLTRIDGAAFDLFSIELAELGPVYAGDITFIANTGYSQSFSLDGILYETETFYFDNEFRGVTSVTWAQDAFHQFDNIVVSNVPLPAPIWMFLSGLIALAGLTRHAR